MDSETPEVIDISKFRPKCVVCGADLPDKRLRHRTCTTECHATYRRWKKYRIHTTECSTCHRPASPEERKDFLAWRKQRGELREGRGRPAVRVERKLTEALERSVKLLRGPITEEQIAAAITDFEKLLDQQRAKQSTLAPSGQTA